MAGALAPRMAAFPSWYTPVLALDLLFSEVFARTKRTWPADNSATSKKDTPWGVESGTFFGEGLDPFGPGNGTNYTDRECTVDSSPDEKTVAATCGDPDQEACLIRDGTVTLGPEQCRAFLLR